jgi:hypothetical protein
MLFRKLFQILVVGGAVLGANSGCSTPAHAQQAGEKKSDGGTQGTASTQGGSDAGTPDAGGGGVPGW